MKVERCLTCNAELTPIQRVRSPVCDRPACRNPWLQEQSRIARAKRFARMAEIRQRGLDQLKNYQTTQLTEDLAGLLSNQPKAALLVPRLDESLEPVSDDLRARFLANLDRALSHAESLLQKPEKYQSIVETEVDASPAPKSLVILNACSTCRGVCCRNGSDHAFLTASFLASRMIQEPNCNPATLKEQYTAFIPSEHIASSCLFHSTTGCLFPREIRGSTCNSFICDGLHEFRREIHDTPDQASIAIAHEDGEPLRVGIMNEHGTRAEFELALG